MVLVGNADQTQEGRDMKLSHEAILRTGLAKHFASSHIVFQAVETPLALKGSGVTTEQRFIRTDS